MAIAPVTPVVLEGEHVRLEPLTQAHAGPLLAAARSGGELFRWTTIPQSAAEMAEYVATALAWREQGSGLAFASVRRGDDVVVGSTRFFLIEHWLRPPGHERAQPDGCEIGFTWLTPAAIRTGINVEAKLLMLQHAFEVWGMQRVCFHTDARNERSRAALTGIGAQFEGVLRAHRLSAELTPRDSARYSVLASEWPRVREQLAARLAGGPRRT
jgi:RimJ/RimL family protein N-acetyltransferase